MVNFVSSIVSGVLVGFGWAAIWGMVLRARGIDLTAGRPMSEERLQTARQKARSTGRLRYVFIHGVLGAGCTLGLAVTVAIMMWDRSTNWTRATILFTTQALLGGSYHGAMAWRRLFRDPVPFPPPMPPLR